MTYDAYSRINYVDYNNAAQMRATMGYDSLGRNNTITYRMGDGTTTVSDTVNRTQSGQIKENIVQSGSNQLWYTYGYDGADRLTSATIGGNSYSYGFGTQDTTACGTGNNQNANSGKNSNRTTQTINGVTSKFCYGYVNDLPVFPATSFKAGRMFVTGQVSHASGFIMRPQPYTVRLHVTGPNDTHSNEFTVPACSIYP